MESSKNPTIDPTLTRTLMTASLAAYADFENPGHFVSPAGYRPVARWTGWDKFFFSGREENFGLVFQSIPTNPPTPQTYIFAFRGTDSDLDIYEDIFGGEQVDFVAWDPSKTPQPAPKVAAGFWDIYTLKGGSMTQSMQQQVFNYLKMVGNSQVYITGHSLGSALSSLFTLDVALCSTIRTMNMNFASPKVGTERWAQVYAQQNPPTLRVFNTKDWVPDLPPAIWPWENYTHVGVPFEVDFYEDQLLPWPIVRHRMLNYQTVLTNAVYRTPQVWAGYFQDAVSPSITVKSVVPSGDEPFGIAKALIDVKQRELAHAAKPSC